MCQNKNKHMKYVWKQNPHEPGMQEAIETMKKKKYHKKTSNYRSQRLDGDLGEGLQ